MPRAYALVSFPNPGWILQSYANLTLLPAGIRTYSKTLYMGVWLGPERKPTARVARRRALAHMGHLTLPAFLTGVLSPDS
jgi:hypothetical protein